jgi:competence protein ComEC
MVADTNLTQRFAERPDQQCPGHACGAMKTKQAGANQRPRQAASADRLHQRFMSGAVSVFIVAIAAVLFPTKAPAHRSKSFEIYFVDVEGGQATLVVTPLGESVLIDAGWAGARDAERIQAVAKIARVKRINYVVITHYHSDHVGGVADLLARMPVDIFVDHGPNAEDSDATRAQYASYEKAIEHSKRIRLQPNQGLPLTGMRLEVLTAAGERITAPLPGVGEANPYCSSEAEAPADASENAQSLGVLITYGRFRFLDLGDLTKKKELELVCPNNLVGPVDLYLTTHHGLAPDNPKALVWALHPRVAIMNNGAHKGGSPEAWQIVHDSPGLSGLWQLHYAADTDKEHNVPEEFIANLNEKGDGHYIKVTATPDGTFTVSNSRNQVWRKYPQEGASNGLPGTQP